MNKYKKLLESFPVELSFTKKYGRMVKASKDLDLGEKLIFEIPTAFCILKQHAQTYCQRCLEKIALRDTRSVLGVLVDNPVITCIHCKKQSYWCSEECKNQDLLHKDSCKYLSCISGIAGAASVDYDLLKLLIIILVQSKRSIEGTPIECLYDLVSHYKSQTQEFRECLKVACQDLVTEFPNDPLFASTTLHDMVKLACKINSNSHAIVDSSRNQAIAVGMFPLIAMCNHSCSPNAVFLSSGRGTLTVMAIKPIKKLDQITVSYVDLFAPRWERRGKLLETKHFWCECERCTSNDKDLLLDSVICSDCTGFCVGESDQTCQSCLKKITQAKSVEIVRQINAKMESGMEMYGAGMFKSACETLQQCLDEASCMVHPNHGIFPSLLVNLVNLYCKTNNLVLALNACDEAIKKMKSIADDAGLGKFVPELISLWEKYLELAEIVLEAIKEGLIDSECLDLNYLHLRKNEALMQTLFINDFIN